MYKLTFVMIASLVGWAGAANAQYVNEKPQRPLFGGPGHYVYPVLCRACKVWQDYRNFAWNQLSMNGGNARSPSNPNQVTTFRIFTHPSKDLYPATVEITLEIVDVAFMSTIVGYTITDPEHFFVEVHPENGDRVAVSFYPKTQGKLVFPYNSRSTANRRSGGFARGTRPDGRRGGGDSSGGSWGRGGFRRGGRSSTGFGGWTGGNAGGNFCGIGTDYICVQF